MRVFFSPLKWGNFSFIHTSFTLPELCNSLGRKPLSYSTTKLSMTLIISIVYRNIYTYELFFTPELGTSFTLPDACRIWLNIWTNRLMSVRTPQLLMSQALKQLNSSSDAFQFSCTIVVSEKTGFIKPRFQVQKHWDERIVRRQVPLDLRASLRPHFNLVSKCQKLRRKNCLPTGATWLTSLS